MRNESLMWVWVAMFVGFSLDFTSDFHLKPLFKIQKSTITLFTQNLTFGKLNDQKTETLIIFWQKKNMLEKKDNSTGNKNNSAPENWNSTYYLKENILSCSPTAKCILSFFWLAGSRKDWIWMYTFEWQKSPSNVGKTTRKQTERSSGGSGACRRSHSQLQIKNTGTNNKTNWQFSFWCFSQIN